MTDQDPASRREEIAAGLARVRARIADGAASAGRDAQDVTLIAVSKTFPVGDLEHLLALGMHDLGEARDQEAAPKAEALADAGVRWHFIGRLQSNKAVSVARYADVVHSVDRLSLVGALTKGALRAERELDCLVQVSLDGDDSRGGAVGQDADRIADALAADGPLRLGGVMAVAPQDVEPGRAFAVLAGIAERLRAAHPQARTVSAGMSGDLEEALAHGATHLRVGGAILGSRPPLR